MRHQRMARDLCFIETRKWIPITQRLTGKGEEDFIFNYVGSVDQTCTTLHTYMYKVHVGRRSGSSHHPQQYLGM
jgi:hypothetical protein